MAALTVQNFASAAAGIAIAIAAHPRIRATGEEDHRQFLGGRDARHGIRSAADFDSPALLFLFRRAWSRI